MYTHGQSVGCLRKKIWGGKPSGHYFINTLLNHLCQAGYQATDVDSCLFSKMNVTDTLLVLFTVDHFLAISNRQILVDNFHQTLATKYTVKRIGIPTDSLGSSLSYHLYRTIFLSRLALVFAVISNADKENAYPAHNSYDYN